MEIDILNDYGKVLPVNPYFFYQFFCLIVVNKAFERSRNRNFPLPLGELLAAFDIGYKITAFVADKWLRRASEVLPKGHGEQEFLTSRAFAGRLFGAGRSPTGGCLAAHPRSDRSRH